MGNDEALPPVEIVNQPRQLALREPDSDEMTVAQLHAQTQKIRACLEAVMIPNEHYGVIPGAKKPSLWKPGAEKLCVMFRLCPEYEIVASTDTTERISFTVRCRLTHIPSGRLVATGLGSCNSREEKYQRPAAKRCPICGKETIFKSKKGPGYYCWQKKGGCGEQFTTDLGRIEDQPSGLADPADLHNTILKMSCKRALVAACLNATAASDCFSQDLEDLPGTARDEDEQPAEPPIGVPPPRVGGVGNWPKQEYVSPAMRDAQIMDDQFRATAGPTGVAPSELEVVLQRSIDENTIEIYNPKTGEFTKEPKATAPQLRKIRVLQKQAQVDDDRLHAGFAKYYNGIDSTKLLTKEQAANTIERLEKTVRTARAAGIPIPEERTE